MPAKHFFFFNREIAWQICGGIERTDRYLITGQCIDYNTDVSDYAQWRPLFAQGESDAASHQCLAGWVKALMKVQGVSHQPFRLAEAS